MNRSLIFLVLAMSTITGRLAWGHGFDLSLGMDSQNNIVVIVPSSESTILNSTGIAVGPENLFTAGFSGTPVSSGPFAGSYSVIHGFADAANAWPQFTATYNILSPLFFSDGTTNGSAALASSGTTITTTNRDAGGPLPGSVAGSLQISGSTSFQTGYGVSLLDPHELGKFLSLGTNPNQTYGEFGFSYEVSVTLAGGQTLTTGPLVDVFATDTVNSGGFYSNAPILQQNAASLAIYSAAIAIPESWNYNGNGNYSDGSKWSQTIPNGMGFTAAFGNGTTTAINVGTLSVTIDRAVYAGTLLFNSATTSYTLATDGVAGHGLVLNNNGVGAGVNVLSGNHTITANLNLPDAGGTTFAISQGSSLTLSGPVSVTGANPTVTLNGAGTLRITSPPTLPSNAKLVINGGTLQLSAATGSTPIGSAVTVTVASAATLELAGAASSLSANVNIANSGSLASGGGLVVSGKNQQAGNIDGTGDLIIDAGGALTANRVNQHALVIGGTSSDPALLTIAASGAEIMGVIDGGAANSADGSPGLVLADALLPTSSFADGAAASESWLSAIDGFDSVPSDSPPLSLSGISDGSQPAVPEPSTLVLAALGLATATIFRRRRTGADLSGRRF